MPKYYIEYGNYIDLETAVITAASQEEALAIAESMAYHHSEGYVGMYGFCEFSEEDEEDEEALAEAIHEEIQHSLEYAAELYEPKKHDIHLLHVPKD